MKVSVTHLRIGMILANLGLAAILVVHYVRSVWKPTESTGWSGVTIRAPGEFEPKADDRAAARGSTAARMASIAPYLEPQKPTVIDPLQTAAAEDATEGEVESEEVREGGPLAENWEYVWLLNFRDSPLDSRVKLRRKAPETRTSSVPGRPQTAIRPGRSITSTRRFPTSAARRTVQPGQEILLKVRERYYKDENLQVDFWIDSADEEKMVYWEPDKPGKFYELKRVASTQYEREDRTVLR
ncbi:MAG: hypothetical protein JXA90_01905, partial [Planctomycetes bacterium]|nr:hypothetical protein [Planctomycetota bacterium]